jgi:histidine triad (HIT) family protein
MGMQDSIFTKIIKGEIPSHKIYEDEKTYAFLDIHPITPGHTLVIPKKQIEFLWDLDDELYQAVMATTKKVAQRMKAVLGSPNVGLQVIGIDVPHTHVHVVPFSTTEEFRTRPDMSAETNHDELAKIAAKLAF